MEALETKTIECQECLGTGKIEKLICTKPVSECCGGFYTYKNVLIVKVVEKLKLK